MQLLANLKADETGLFKNFNRMSSDFDFLLNKIEDKVSRVDTNYRDNIPASVRLALTLRFLATGDTTAIYYIYITKKYHVFAPMGRFQLESIYLYFPPSSHQYNSWDDGGK